MNILNDKKTLTSLLIKAVAALIDLVDQNKLKKELPISQYDIVWFKDVGGRGEAQREHRTEVNLYHLDELVGQLASQSRIDDSIKALGELAQSIVEKGSWPVGIPAPLLSENHLAELLLITYFRTVKSLSLDETIARDICQGFVDAVRSDSYGATSIYLVDSFNAPRAFQLDRNVQFRPISMQDIEQFGAVAPGQFPSFHEPWLSSSHWICETLDTGTKSTMEAYNRHNDSIEEIMGALNLTASGRSGFRLLQHRFSSPFFRFGTLSSRNVLHSGGIGGNIDLDDTALDMFIDHYKLVKRIFKEARFQAMRLPFRRIRSAALRGENEDKLVDYVIGLERLLAPDSSTLEVTFRFRLRGAAVLPESFGDVKQRIEFMNKLYSLRSDIVHGRAKAKEINEMLPQAEKSFISIFRWFAQALGVVRHNGVIQQLDNALVSEASERVMKILQPTEGSDNAT